MRLSAVLVASFIFALSIGFMGAPAPAFAAGCTSAEVAEMQVQLSIYEAQLQLASGLRAQILELQIQLLRLKIAECDDAPPTPDDDDACLVITNNLAIGSTDATTGGDVSRLQRFLGGEVTGYYGLQTARLVTAWQTANGIPPVGAVGPVTRAAMMASCTDGTGTSPGTATSTASAVIDQSSLRHDENVDVRITGTAKNVRTLDVFIVPSGDFGVAHNDYDGLDNQVGKDGFFKSGADVRSNGSWAAEFGDSHIPEGTSFVLVFDGSKETLLARAPLVIDTDEVTKAEAQAAIRDAEDAIEDAQEAYDEAEEDGDVPSYVLEDAAEDLEEALDEFERAEDAFGNGAYALAYEEAVSAKGWAESALERLEESDAGRFTYSLVNKALDPGESWALGSDLRYFVLKIHNSQSSTQKLTFPTNCWWTYRIVERGTERVAYDLADDQSCMRPGSSPATTFNLRPGESKTFEFDHLDSLHRLPAGSYAMKLDVLSDPPAEEAAAFPFRIVATATTSTPTVSVSVSPSTITVGQSTTLSWSSTNAQYCSMGDKLGTSGSMTLSPEKTKTYTVRCVNGSASAEASVTVTVRSVTTPVDSFTATPTAGYAPLTVAFKGTANQAKSCDGGSRRLSFGDGEVYQILFPADLCRASAWSVSHTYAKAGSYTAALYAGKEEKGTALQSMTIKVAAMETPRPPVTPTTPIIPSYPLYDDSETNNSYRLEAAAYASLMAALDALSAQLAALTR